MPKAKKTEDTQSEIKDTKNDDVSEDNKTIDQKITDLTAALPSREALLAEADGEVDTTSAEEAPSEDSINADEVKTSKIHQSEENEENIEDTARRQGWVPKEEYNGDPDNWRSAEEYVARGPLMDRLAEQNREIKDLRKNFETLATLTKKQTELLNEPKMDKILEQKRAAIEEGDIAAVEKYEADYNKAKQEMEQLNKEVPATPASSEVAPEVSTFIERNKSWFNNETLQNSGMAAFAIKVEADLERRNPGWSLTERLNETEKMVKDQFSSRFENPNRNKPAVVEGKTVSVKKDPRKMTYNDLPEKARKIVNGLVRADRTGKMTKDDYAQQLFVTGAVQWE